MKTTSRQKYVVPAVVILVILGVGITAWAISAKRTSNRATSTSPADTQRPKASEGQATFPSPSNPAVSTSIPKSTTYRASDNGSVTITSPTQGSTVTSGTKVTGTASTAGEKLTYRLKGGKSGQLALGPISVSGAGTTATPFSFELAFSNQVAPGGDQGVLEVFITGTNGTEQSIANVAVNIQ